MARSEEEEVTEYDLGYHDGYQEGYNAVIRQVISWLYDEKFTEAAEALQFLISPEGKKELNDTINDLYRKLAALAKEKHEGP